MKLLAGMLQEALNVAEPLDVLEREACVAISDRPILAGLREDCSNPAGRLRERLPYNLKRGHRFGQTLERQVADRGEAMALAAGQTAYHVRYENLSRRCRRAKSRGFHYRRTEEIIALRGRFTRRYADTDLERRCAFLARRYGRRLLHRDRACNRIGCTREAQHEPVAGGLDLAAIVVGNCQAKPVEMRMTEQFVGIVAEAACQLGRADQVRECDRDSFGTRHDWEFSRASLL